jgi:hypothetical protein
MHVENELVGYVTRSEQEYDEVIEEYEEEVLIQEEFPESPVTDTVVAGPAQGKPWCMTLIFVITIYINIGYTFTLQELYGNHMHI